VKRQRHVFPSGEIAHLWYHKTQESARNATGSFYFSGDTVYSYGSHFPIARHVSNGKQDAVLFTTKTYSVTTSGHCSAVRSSIPSSADVFEVPNVELGQTAEEHKHQHTANIADYISRIAALVQKSLRARGSFQMTNAHADATALAAECELYAHFFHLRKPKLPSIPGVDSRRWAIAKDRENAQREREEEKRQREEWAKQEAERAERWRNGENIGYFHVAPVMLRLSADGQEVETSRGARVPVSHALRGLRFVRAVVARGEAYQRNGHTLHLGHYAIDRIDADGTLHAGCHVIPLAEIERIAPVLESLPVSDSAVEVQ
jgi:hypothetical protein